MTTNEVLKECRVEANRKSGKVVLTNMTLSSAYNNVCSGYISTYDYNTSTFNGL